MSRPQWMKALDDFRAALNGGDEKKIEDKWNSLLSSRIKRKYRYSSKLRWLYETFLRSNNESVEKWCINKVLESQHPRVWFFLATIYAISNQRWDKLEKLLNLKQFQVPTKRCQEIINFAEKNKCPLKTKLIEHESFKIAMRRKQCSPFSQFCLI